MDWDVLYAKCVAVANRKKNRTRTTYASMLPVAGTAVPCGMRDVIKGDVPRTFSSMPTELQPEDIATGQLQLQRVLLAFAHRELNSRVRGTGASYTQGMNYVAAMCLALTRQDEELAFWLLAAIVEDSLGLRFYSDWPPLIGYRAVAKAVELATYEGCPRLMEALGNDADLSDLVAVFCARALLPLGVGVMPLGPLVAFWTDLIDTCTSRDGAEAEPLLRWAFALLQSVEDAACTAATEAPEPESRTPAAMKEVISGTHNLAEDWRWDSVPLKVSPEQLVAFRDEAMKVILAQTAKQELTRCMQVPLKVVESLHSEFLLLPKRGEGIDLGTLQGIVARLSPETPAEAVRGLFVLLDSNGSGALDFFQLMTGIIALSGGSRETKLKHLFDLYDTDRKGTLDTDELHCLANALAVLLEDRGGTPAGGSTVGQSVISTGLSVSGRSVISEVPTGSLVSEVENRLAKRRSIYIPPHLKRQSWSLSSDQHVAADRIHRRLLLMGSKRDQVEWNEFCMGFFSDEELVFCLASIGIGLTDNSADVSDWDEIAERLRTRQQPEVLPNTGWNLMMQYICCNRVIGRRRLQQLDPAHDALNDTGQGTMQGQ